MTRTPYHEIREVTWLDSKGGPGWTGIEELSVQAKPMSCVSVGYVLFETHEYVTLVQSFDTQAATNADNYIAIPKFAVLSSRTLRKARS